MRLPICIVLIAAVAGGLFAGQNRWTESTPERTYVRRIYVAPGDANTVYADTVAGFYRSTDHAATWTSIQLPPDDITMFVTAGDATLYAASGRTMYVSRNRGDQWQIIATSATKIDSMAYDERDEVLYRGTETGIAFSNDQGSTWIDATIPAGNAPVVVLALSSNAAYAVSAPSNPVAGRPAVSAALLRSTDGGRSWKRVNDGVVPLCAGTQTSAIYTQSGALVSVSNDVGSSWTKLPLIHGARQVALALDGPYLYAATDVGVFAFASGSWQSVGTR